MIIRTVSKFQNKSIPQGIKLNVLLIGIVSLLVSCAAINGLQGQSIQVIERDGNYQLTIPASQVVLSIPKEQLVPAESGRARYFHFNDNSGFNISGWFDQGSLYQGPQSILEEIKGFSAQSGMALSKNISSQRQGDWDVVLYSMEGIPNMRANCVLAGTWIDLHLSCSPDSEDKLLSYLKRVQLEIKKN